MSLHSWLRSFRNASRPPHHKRMRSARLGVEPLEDRCTPTAGLSASLVADIVPSAASSNPVSLQNVNGTLYFGAVGPSSSTEGLYKSDGTAAGTILLKGGVDGSTFDFTPLNGRVLFFTDGGLWKTDGTPGGTALLKSVWVPDQGDRSLTASNGKVFFSASDGTNGAELWKSDGTSAGTVLVKDIYAGSTTYKSTYTDENGKLHHSLEKVINSSGPGWLTDFNGTLFFTAADGAGGRELWKSDGTARGTQLVKDINPGSAGSNPQGLTVVNGVLYFFADDGTYGAELWKSDGTAAGTVLVKDINPGSAGSFRDRYTLPLSVTGRLFFAANDGVHGTELWKSDGTTAGTVLVRDINPSADSSGAAPTSVTNVNGTLFFTDNDAGGSGLWKSDGTDAGTVFVKELPSWGTHDLTNVNGLLYFTGYDTHGSELWQSDGTAEGTVLVQDIYPGTDANGFPNSSNPSYLVAMNNKLYFSAYEPVHGQELWDPPPVGLGPIIDLSDPDVLAACGSNGAEKESFIAVNPTNPNNIVATWWGGLAFGTVAAVTFDGGTNWQQVIVPVTQCTGGGDLFQRVVDPWLAFAANGDLYHISLPGNVGVPNGISVSKSLDGGLHWGSPTVLDYATDTRFQLDKPSITADAANSSYVYAAWEQTANGNRRVIKFSRTTDGGVTWEPVRPIFDPGNSDQVSCPQILVLPDGTLVCVFLDLRFSNSNGGTQKEGILSVIRSTDKGQTWSAMVQGPAIPVFQATDPETGHRFVNQNSYPPVLSTVAIDRNNGNLYVVFEDNRPSNGQYSDISFTMSTDGGFTWSQPIQVNQTPTNIPPGNRQAFLPSVAVAADGTIGVTYYDFRFNNANPGLPTDYRLVRCRPSATAPATDPANWGGELRLTDASFDLEKAAQLINEKSTPYFLGDYEGLTAVGNDFLAAWGQPHDTDLDSVFFRRAFAAEPLLAADVGHNCVSPTLTSQQVAALLPVAIHRWQGAGVDTSALARIDLRIANLGGATLGLAAGHTVWLDDNAAGWGWSVDPTPYDDSEFTTLGNQGEQHRMDLLTVVEHEVGHLLGYDHADDGVMAETLTAGVRRAPVSSTDIDWLGAVDLLFASSSPSSANKGPGWPCHRDPICK